MNLHVRPLFPIAVVYIAGIVLSTETRLPPSVALLLGTTLVLAASVMPTGKSPRVVALLAAGVFLLGMLRTSAAWVVPADDVSRLAEGKMVYLKGVIVSDPEPRDDGSVRFVVRAESAKTYTSEYPVTGKAMISIYRPKWEEHTGDYVPFHGDRVILHGRLRVPAPAANPNSGSYGDYLMRRGMYCTLSASTGDISRVGFGGGGVRHLAAVAKRSIMGRIVRMLPGDRGSLLIGILLGNYAALPLRVQSAFMRTGTMHLLAASGYNCGVILLIFRWILCRLTVPRAWMHILLIALLWAFALLVGMGPSIVRATVMVTAFLAAYLLWRSPDLLNIVLLSGLVILGANPLNLYDVGFQLSFAAVLAIITLTPFLERLRVSSPSQSSGGVGSMAARGANWAWRNVFAAVTLSAAATVGSAPITAYYFNYVSVVSIAANAAVALLVVALTAFGLTSLSASWIPLLGPVLAAFSSWIAGAILYIVTALSGLSWASWSVRSPSWIMILAYYGCLLVGVELTHWRRHSPVRDDDRHQNAF